MNSPEQVRKPDADENYDDYLVTEALRYRLLGNTAMARRFELQLEQATNQQDSYIIDD